MAATFLCITTIFLLVTSIYSCPLGCRCPGERAISISCDFTNSTYASGFFCPEKLRFLTVSVSNQRVFDHFDLTVCRNLISIIVKSKQVYLLRSGRLASLKNLKRLQLQCNLTLIEDGAFSGLDLSRLSISGNGQLQALKNNTFAGLSVKALIIQYNGILNINEHLFNQKGLIDSLKLLIFSHNQIYSISKRAFTSLRALKTLDLSYNKLHSLGDSTFKGLFRLKTLKLSNNQLNNFYSPIFSDNIRGLEKLDLSSNRIKSLYDVVGFPKLNYLNLEKNQLVHMPLQRDWSTFPNLQTVKVSGNKFKCIEREELPPARIKMMSLALCGKGPRILRDSHKNVEQKKGKDFTGKLQTNEGKLQEKVQSFQLPLIIILSVGAVILIVSLVIGVVCWKFYRLHGRPIRLRQINDTDDESCQEMVSYPNKIRDSCTSEMI